MRVTFFTYNSRGEIHSTHSIILKDSMNSANGIFLILRYYVIVTCRPIPVYLISTDATAVAHLILHQLRKSGPQCILLIV